VVYILSHHYSATQIIQIVRLGDVNFIFQISWSIELFKYLQKK